MAIFLRARPDSANLYGLARYCLEILIVAVVYFALTNITTLAIPSTASVIWAPTGLALAAVVVRGLHVWPAIFLGAFAVNLSADVANASSASAILFASLIAIGNTLTAVVGGCLVGAWSAGRHTFESPTRVASFMLFSALSAAIGAFVGVGALSIAGSAAWTSYGVNVAVWWLRDVAGAFVIAPVLILWAASSVREFTLWQLSASAGAFIGAAAIGVLAYSPLFGQSALGNSLAILGILPLLWAALRCGPRDTATVALILSCFAIWGTLAGGAHSRNRGARLPSAR